VGSFFFPLVAISALKKAGEKFPVDRVLIKASCVIMTPSANESILTIGGPSPIE
jgi:hypothetical protein